MRILLILLVLAFFPGLAHGQTQTQNFISIDHIPIAVKNLDNVKKTLSELLHFKVKEGRMHEGIANCFLKFQDGTYLEFITPIDSVQAIGKYYADFLKDRQGGTSLAISINNSDALIHTLSMKSISYTTDSNRVWKTIELKDLDLFFIDYFDKQWNDSKTNTTHVNTALSLKSTYILSSTIGADVEKYTSLGFHEMNNGIFLNIPFKHLVVGESNLYLLDASKSNKIKHYLGEQNLTGICGFEIKVKSLTTLTKLLENTKNVTVEKKQILLYLQDLNLFFVFTE